MLQVRGSQKALLLVFTCAALLSTPRATHAQCLFDHPSDPATGKVGAAEYRLIPAFVSSNNNPACEPLGVSNAPNNNTAFGWPGFSPPQTQHILAGSPANGWQFGNLPTFPSWGGLRFKRVNSSAFCPSRDLRIQMRLFNIVDASGLASGPGTLYMVLRTTQADPSNGDITMVDMPVSFAFTLTGGAVTFSAYLGDYTVNTGQGCFAPACSSLDFVNIEVRDENGNVFARPGIQF
jgi:hypothetical protein